MKEDKNGEIHPPESDHEQCAQSWQDRNFLGITRVASIGLDFKNLTGGTERSLLETQASRGSPGRLVFAQQAVGQTGSAAGEWSVRNRTSQPAEFSVGGGSWSRRQN
jgi:hypothetical protein